MAGYGLRTIGKIEDGQPTGASTLSAVATVLSRRLKRAITTSDLLQPSDDGCSCLRRLVEPSCVVQEAVKLLDFSQWRPAAHNGHAAAESRVVLCDHYRFRKLTAERTLHFHYASTGPRIDGRCLTHAHSWLPVTGWAAGGASGPHLNIAYQLRVELEKTDAGAVEVENRLEYVDAFPAEDGEWFQTHVVFPTESLTLLALLPPHKRCRAATGLVKQHPVEPFSVSPEEPMIQADGRRIFWHLTAPQQGGTYQLEWRW